MATCRAGRALEKRFEPVGHRRIGAACRWMCTLQLHQVEIVSHSRMDRSGKNRNQSWQATSKSKRRLKGQMAIERAMEALEQRMLLSVTGFQPAVNYTVRAS